MGNFNLPRFQYIINSDEQAQLYGDDGTGPVPYVTGLVSPTAGKFSLIGELDWIGGVNLALLASATRIIVEQPSDGSQRTVNYSITGVVSASVPAQAGDVIRVITTRRALDQTLYQNIPIEKRYQLTVNCDTAGALGDEIAAVINADPNAPVTVTSDGAGGVTSVNKKYGEWSGIYAGSTVDGNTPAWTLAVAGVPTTGENPINTYEALKNLQWSVGVDFDRNAEYFPIKGARYVSYLFHVNAEEVASGGHTLPSQVPGTFETEFIVYVEENLALKAAMDLLATDVNV